MDCVGYCRGISFVCGMCPVSQNTEMETEAGNDLLFFSPVQPVCMFVYEFKWTIIRCGQILKLPVLLSNRIQFRSFFYNPLS